ncbi:tyrosinase family oxidase copper chaperone [Streptomyces sp. NPDC051569]|uniref:tyrosinase family oxidase copper chaperone n=1 Tax=Streptomyces sp. NPDC051569 TaxID=3365661 RepID=UPI003788B530
MPGRIRIRPGLAYARRPEPVARRGRSRRQLLRTVFTFGVAAGTAGALAPILGAGRRATALAADERTIGDGLGGFFEEIYRGRHIAVGSALTSAGGPATPAAPVASVSPLSPALSADVRIDGRILHLMRRADGGYLSLVNHYESFPTPLEAARAAIDDLGGAQLSLSGPVHHV